MLNAIRLQNFKAIRDSGLIQLGPITLLVGPNSSGKSSVLQALLAGRETARTDVGHAIVLANDGDFDLGSFPDVARRGVNPAWFAVTFELTGEDGEKKRPIRVELRSELRYLKRSRAIYVSRSTVIAQRGRKKWETGVRASAPSRWPGMQPNIETSTESFIAYPVDLPVGFESVEPVLKQLPLELASIRHVGAMREEPRRGYPLKGNIPVDVGRRGQRTPELLFAAGRKKSWRERLMPALNRALGDLGISTEIEAHIPPGTSMYSVVLEHLRPAIRVNLASVGFGISQILPVLVEIINAPAQTLFLVEQPEIHLHPRAQSRIADFLANAAMDDGERKRFVVETHSEHLIRKLQVLIADPDHPLTNKDVHIYFFEPHNSGTKIRRLDLDESGHFQSDWPRGFFDESVNLSIQHLQALKKRARRSEES